MKLNHVISLKIAKQLKDMGWKRETEFWWVLERYSGGEPIWVLLYKEDKNFKRLCIDHNMEHYPAPLATEILEELPKNYYF